MLIKSKHRNFSVFHKGGTHLCIKKWGKTRTLIPETLQEQKNTVGVGENQLGDLPGSHQPVVLLFIEVLGPLAGQLQIVVRLVGLVVQIQAGCGFLGDSPFYLRALVPLVKGRNGNNFWPDGQSRLQGRLVVASVHPVPGVVVVPRPDGCVHVPGTDAGDEEQIV